MHLHDTTDTTTLSYWLNWRVYLCAICVLLPMVLAFVIIWKNEGSRNFTGENQQDRDWTLPGDVAWKPCLKEIHPICLLAFRVIAFSSLLATLVAKIQINGGTIFYYYTQWTFTLVTIYFGMNAGAVMLTDCVYWFIIFSFLTLRDYDLNFMTVNMHTLNVILLLGDTALNCLRIPWIGISFFVLWTGVYVIFQWIIHACVSIWWPYPFLDLSSSYAPLWYLLMALFHIPCYGFFVLIVKMKHYFLSKWFPSSNQC